MHFDFTITAGNIMVVVTLITLGWKYYGLHKRRIWEHDTLWFDFSRRVGFRVTDPEEVVWEKLMKSEVKGG